MKRKTKLALGGITLLLGTIILSGCTANYCTVTDKAHILYAYDYGVTDYTAEAEGNQKAFAYIDGNKVEFDNVYYKAFSTEDSEARSQIYTFCSTYKKIDESATKNGIRLPSITFLTNFDAVVLGHALKASGYTTDTAKSLSVTEIVRDYKDTSAEKGVLDNFGYLKYEDSLHDKKVLWTNFTTYVDEAKAIVGVDDSPSSDYWNLYKSTMNSNVNNVRTCLAIEKGDYGAYGPRGVSVEIQGKKWTDWKGLLEFILVWPIGAFIDVLTKAFLTNGIIAGWAQLLSILVVTFVVRSLMLIFTIKQSASTAKMNELQPEIQKIQAKYPNSNTDQNQKQRMAAEMQKLYKKHKINPLSSILVMIVQFPIFICVWGALTGSAWLSTGQFLGMNFTDSISSILFNGSNWASGAAWTALVLFLLMAAAQVVSMLLPQWLQKKRQAKVAKLGKNPAQTQQNRTMKIVTYAMMIMIIVMGFSLASAMGVYWFIGALISVAQTLITQSIIARHSKEKK